MFLDYFVEKNKFSGFTYESKFKADISSWFLNGEKTLFLKPQTFMNLSWESVIAVKNFYKIEASEIIIIFDDMSMEFWKVRYREGGSAWGHNGIKDIIRILWPDFPRLKVWVWYDKRYNVSNWVLSKFDEEELIDLDNEVWKKIEEKLEEIIVNHE
jgi:PTH1 family peptidyl-tRNA hydrolase